MNVRCKMVVTSVTEIQANNHMGNGRAWQVRLTAIWEGAAEDGANKCIENRVFGLATPNAETNMTIMNPDAAAQFRAGDWWYVDFSLAASAEVRAAESASATER